MKFLRKILDNQEKHFKKGGKLEKLYPLFEAQDTILFTPGHVTKGLTHVRDALDLKRMMIMVVVALLPCLLFGMWNVGDVAHDAIVNGGTMLDTWQTTVFADWLGLELGSWWANALFGALYFLPVLIACFAAGGIVEVVFSMVRGHEVNEGFLVTGFLLPLTLPPTIPLWQVALGTAFGVIFGKEVFGGTGKNILNPALVARAFLFFAYPAQISGDLPWIAARIADGKSGATTLANSAAGAIDFSLADNALGGTHWMDAFIGFEAGSMGETSALLCLVGALILIATQIGSWRTMLGVVLGTAATALLLNAVGSETNPMFAMPFWWHMVVGGWAFGTVFMATDPVSSAFTDWGKLLYGAGIGVMAILVRVVNPAYPEGMMLAILFMNMFAPFIDHFFVQANIKRRLARNAT